MEEPTVKRWSSGWRFWLVMFIAFLIWKAVFSTDVAHRFLRGLLGDVPTAAAPAPISPPSIAPDASTAAPVGSLSYEKAVAGPISTNAPIPERLAQEAARQHNANPLRLDGMTISSTASAVGTRVVIKNVMRLKPNLAPEEIATFSTELRREAIGLLCGNLAELLRAGVSYAFFFESTHGQLAAAFPVAMQDCQSR